jgi:SH3-like domain-containing protein
VIAAALCLGLLASLAPEGPAGARDEPATSTTGRVTGLTLPRFVSLKKSRVNLRQGPGESYKVRWVYVRQSLPVEVIAEHEHWRKVRDLDGDEGWVHYSLLDGRRHAVVRGQRATLWKKPDRTESKVVAFIDPNVIVRIRACRPDWCRVEIERYKGWLERDYLSGLYEGETLN